MNHPTYSVGVFDDSDDLWMTTDHIIEFRAEIPGLSGDSTSASFKSIGDGKYISNQHGLLDLKSIEQSEQLKKAASFKIHKDKFFNVSNVYMHGVYLI